MDLSVKFTSQITTSKHFYNVTAHRYVEENCCDMGMKVVRGLSADMDDLLTEKGQQEARNFFDQLLFSCQHGLFLKPSGRAPRREKSVYQPVLPSAPKNTDKDVVIVTNYSSKDENLKNIISDLCAALPYEGNTAADIQALADSLVFALEESILQMKLVGALIAIPSVQKKMKGQMNQYIIGPYQKVIETAAKNHRCQSDPIPKESAVYDRNPEKQKNK